MLNNIKGEQLILSATFFAAIGWVASKQVVAVMPIAQFISWRFVLAALVILPLCWRSIKRADFTLLLSVFSVGVVLAAHLLLWIHAVSISDSLGEGAFIMSLAMLLAPLVAWPMLRQMPTHSFWVALPIAVCGMALLSLSNGWQLSGNQLYFLVSALLLSIHFNLNRKLVNKLPPLTVVCIQLFAVGVSAFIVSLFSETVNNSMTVSTWSWFLISAVLATSLRYFLQSYGQSKLDTASASVLMILEPIWTLVFSIVIFGEALSVSKVAGCGLIVLSLYVYRTLGKKEQHGAETYSAIGK